MAIYKLTPILMAGNLLLGLMLATGHHFYYDFLDGRTVYSQGQQEWLFRIGTGIAFLAKTALLAAIGIAYMQILWKKLQSNSTTIQRIDSLFGVIDNISDFATSELWRATPTLAVVAAIAWVLPLVAVITPATLTVELSSQPNRTSVIAPIPIVNYENWTLFGSSKLYDSEPVIAPSPRIAKILLSVASSGSILNMPAPFPNSSYSVNMYGPSISCDNPGNVSFTKYINDIINYNTFGDPVKFVAFIPTLGPGHMRNRTEEEYASTGLLNALYYSASPDAQTLDYTTRDAFGTNKSAARLYFVLRSALSDPTNSLTECQLYNSSYTIDFTFKNGQQDISYKSKNINPVSVLDWKDCQHRSHSECSTILSYLSLMDCLGKLLVGTVTVSPYGITRLNQTQILNTVLTDYREWGRLYNTPMSDALEELFTNLTVSLFSKPLFLQNNTVASRGRITYLSPQNAFSYKPQNLLIAYGVSLFTSTIIVIIGLICIKSNSASYTYSFSTILRTTRNPGLDTVIPEFETSGAEPLSKQLGGIRLFFQSEDYRSGGNTEGKARSFVIDLRPRKTERAQEGSPAQSLLGQSRQI